MAALLALVIAINLTVDPFHIYGDHRFAGINKVRTEVSGHTRLAKAYAIRRIRPDAIALGSSRTEHGIDTNHTGWNSSTSRRYNAALTGANIEEVSAYLRHAVSIGTVTQAVVGLDFFMFNTYWTPRPDFDPSILGGHKFDSELAARFKLFQTATAASTIFASVGTVRAQSSAPLGLEPDGRRGDGTFEKVIARRGGYRESFIASESEFISDVYLPLPSRKYSFSAPGRPDSFKLFADMLDLASESGVELYLFLSPAHARQWEVIRSLDLWPTFEDWKRRLVEAIELHNRKWPTRPVRLWDFAMYSPVATERVPQYGSRDKMQGYWDSSHYKKEVGDRVLLRMFGPLVELDKLESSFGVELNSRNIDAVISEQRSRQSRYHSEQPDTVAEIDALVRRLRPVSVATGGVGAE